MHSAGKLAPYLNRCQIPFKINPPFSLSVFANFDYLLFVPFCSGQKNSYICQPKLCQSLVVTNTKTHPLMRNQGKTINVFGGRLFSHSPYSSSSWPCHQNWCWQLQCCNLHYFQQLFLQQISFQIQCSNLNMSKSLIFICKYFSNLLNR